MTDMVVYLTIKYIYRSSLKYQIYTIECVKEFGTDKKCAIIQIPGILFYELVCTPHKHTCPLPSQFNSVEISVNSGIGYLLHHTFNVQLNRPSRNDLHSAPHQYKRCGA